MSSDESPQLKSVSSLGGPTLKGLETQLREEPSPDGVVHSPDVLELLESLDDVMFAAIDADPNALDSAKERWTEVVDRLGIDELEETRQQYLRHAKGVWDELRSLPEYPPHRLFAALEVIALLAHQAER